MVPLVASRQMPLVQVKVQWLGFLVSCPALVPFPHPFPLLLLFHVLAVLPSVDVVLDIVIEVSPTWLLSLFPSLLPASMLLLLWLPEEWMLQGMQPLALECLLQMLMPLLL